MTNEEIFFVIEEEKRGVEDWSVDFTYKYTSYIFVYVCMNVSRFLLRLSGASVEVTNRVYTLVIKTEFIR